MSIKIKNTDIPYNAGANAVQAMVNNGVDEETAHAIIQSLGHELLGVDMFPDETLQPFRFTFGSASYFPYGLGQYVLVYALSRKEAVAKYRMRHPDHNPDTICCSSIYSESSWNKIDSSCYECMEIIY